MHDIIVTAGYYRKIKTKEIKVALLLLLLLLFSGQMVQIQALHDARDGLVWVRVRFSHKIHL